MRYIPLGISILEGANYYREPITVLYFFDLI